MTIRIDPYKTASKSAKALSRYTGILRATRKQVQRHGTFDTVLNWGNSERRFNSEYINNPEAVAVASDKLRSCRRFGEADVNQPPYTTSKATARAWLETEGCTILARRLRRASGGRGIERYGRSGDSIIRYARVQHDGIGIGETGEVDNRSSDGGSREDRTVAGVSSGQHHSTRRGIERRVVTDICDAPLYTRYVKKADEYRVHVFDGRVIDIQQKRKRKDIPNEEIDYQIRNAASGWVYCRDDVACPPACSNLAVRAVAALCLDFGAVDIGYNHHTETACVYEVNTAPGLEGTTLTRYQEAIECRLPQIGRGAYARRKK